jgi:hypothetical protein
MEIKKLYTPKEVADITGFSIKTLANLRAKGGNGGPKFCKFQKAVRYLHDDLTAWINKSRYSSTSEYRGSPKGSVNGPEKRT